MEAPAVEVIASTEVPSAHDEHHDDLPTSKPALTPPTSEDMDKRGRSSSELSELSDEEDEEDIEPDHYFEGGKIPVFKPTMDQFRSFKKFIDRIDKHGMKSGIVKVIPPKEWRGSLPDLKEAVKSIRVKNPITQEFAGQHGIYTQQNMEKQRSYSLPEWKSLTLEHHHQPPAKRGERRRGQETVAARRVSKANPASSPSPSTTPSDTPRRGPGRPRKKPLKQQEEDGSDKEVEMSVPPTPTSPSREEEPQKPKKVVKIKEETTPSKPKGRQPRTVSSRRRNNQNEMTTVVDEEAFKNFNHRLETVDQFTPERCHELEDNYWRTINYGQPMYGADMPGSLFDDRTKSWNVAKLENLLDVLGTKVPGVNTAYLYLGMWKATFAWHLEDMDLYSINYIHFGAPKQWYSISQEDARRFEAAMKSIWPNDAKNCSQFLRHKTYLISPAQLEKQFNIKVNRLVHYEGEFVITYPYGYHSGYNLGYNCAESVNFANEAWLNYGKIAKKCECELDSVWVEVAEIERKLRDMDDGLSNLPSPPASVAGKAKAPARKRKRPTAADKKGEPPKKKRLKLLLKPRETPCILCPNDPAFDEILPTDNGLKAHRLCAEYTPETFLSEGPNPVVCGVSKINKARLELRCNYCRSKRGAVFQCSAKKCARAFHATCAPAAGIQVDIGPMPTFDEEGTEYYYDGYDFRCRFHRPKKRSAKLVDGDTLENDKLIQEYARGLKPKDVVQVQYCFTDQSQIFAGVVVENRPAEWTVVIDVLPEAQGDRVEIEWKYLLHLDPADSQRPKPSANAIPIPVHLKESDASLNISNRTDGIPEMGDPFQDANAEQKWAELVTQDVRHPSQAKVNLDKENQLWYYLGATSTEARAQYTEDLAKPRQNTKANFLDTVKPAPALPPPAAPRRSYPASYPVKPAPQTQPQNSQNRSPVRPYQYKPRADQYGNPVPTTNYNYPSDQYRYPPNGPTPYDSRATVPQYGYPYNNGYPQPSPTPQYHSHFSPGTTFVSGARPVQEVRGNQFPRSSHSPHNSYYQTAAPPIPQYSHYQNYYPQPPTQTAGLQQPPPRSVAPVANMMGSSAAASSKPQPTYATNPCSPSSRPSLPAPYQSSYANYDMSSNSGHSSDWKPIQSAHSKLPPLPVGPPSQPSQPTLYRPPSLNMGSKPLNFGSDGSPATQAAAPAPPTHRPALQFQTPQQFQQDIAQQAPVLPKLDYFKGLGKDQASPSGAPDVAPTGTSIAPKPQPQQRPPTWAGQNANGGPMQEPPRPIPSPISDTSRSPPHPSQLPQPLPQKQPEYIPPQRPQLPMPVPQLPMSTPAGETWRYS
ncbi:hypothetical protein BU16DRAFT_127854 [Lophium mytilinum]|uniref:[histone H3]-trimethyl-L-lysine(9) demethylase n=1 Tax=Lophium mytilinum TaxID=390894 RepID=A0A6A6QIC6_9PEZI|nr:hypothetical protein BU16DRAFT_127854 [Lophium mytilinum]